MADIIFDIDGTLWDTTDVVAVAWNKAVKESKVEELKDLVITGDRLKKEFGKPMDVIADNLFGDIDSKLKARILDSCCEYEHEEIANCETDLSYPGMRESMKALSKDNRLFIVSNCQSGYIELVIAKNNLEDYITDFECFGNTNLQKDENIRLVMKRNNIDTGYYFGDTQGDYEASTKAGTIFIHAEYGFMQVPEAEYKVGSFEEFVELIKKINSK